MSELAPPADREDIERAIIVMLVRRRGHRPNKINSGTDLLVDLGIAGDDGHEFILELIKMYPQLENVNSEIGRAHV